MEIRRDCVHFRGDRPCAPHKDAGKTCTCDVFAPRGRRILIIKLGALGDVVRTTPLVRALAAREPTCEITWVTRTPELLPPRVDHPLPLDAGTLARLLADRFDLAINLDKDREACALLELVRAGERRGFGLEDGHCAPRDPASAAKFQTGLDDGLNRENRRSYVGEALAIAGLPFEGERYLMPPVDPSAAVLGWPGPRIGLNTSVGARWPKRRWPAERWIALVARLREAGMTPVALGGPEDAALHERLRGAGAESPSPGSLADLAGRIRALDALVSPVTLAAHLAIGHGVPLVLLNNLFNRAEFELYGGGVILEPAVPCLGCFATACPLPCLETIDEATVLSAVADLLVRRPRAAAIGYSGSAGG